MIKGKLDERELKIIGKVTSNPEIKVTVTSIGTSGKLYEHPDKHPASMIEEDIDRNFVTVRQKNNLYGHIHEQIKASKTWVISHTLDKHPSISVVDSSGNQVTGSPKYIDKNNVVIEFTSEFSGKAYLN